MTGSHNVDESSQRAKNHNIIAKFFVGAVTFVVAMPIFADTETVDGIEWNYTVSDGKAKIMV